MACDREDALSQDKGQLNPRTALWNVSDVSGLFSTVLEHMSLFQRHLPFPVGVYKHQSHGHQHALSVSYAHLVLVLSLVGVFYFYVSLLYFGHTPSLYVFNLFPLCSYVFCVLYLSTNNWWWSLSLSIDILCYGRAGSSWGRDSGSTGRTDTQRLACLLLGPGDLGPAHSGSDRSQNEPSPCDQGPLGPLRRCHTVCPHLAPLTPWPPGHTFHVCLGTQTYLSPALALFYVAVHRATSLKGFGSIFNSTHCRARAWRHWHTYISPHSPVGMAAHGKANSSVLINVPATRKAAWTASTHPTSSRKIADYYIYIILIDERDKLWGLYVIGITIV